MPEIHAFRGVRYDLGHVGSLSDVIAPPYDVIGPELQDELYKKHPANSIRIILNREEPGDTEADNRYTRAARFYRNWQREGVLMTEPDPAVYVYHQTFDAGGRTFTRRGFMCRVRLERFGEGKIYPHEETHASAKADRLKLWQACKANCSQIFGLYPDPENQAQDLLEEAIVGKTPLEATDHLGVVSRMWAVTDVKTITKLAAIVGPKPTFVADGHHRYETACNYRDQLAQKQNLDKDHPANFVMMMCVGMSDPGLIVLPTHRLFHGVPEMSSSELIARLGDSFQTRVVGEGPDLAHMVWQEIERGGDQGALGFFTAPDQRWVLARLTDAGRSKMAQLSSDHSEDWQGLGVAILHRLVMENLLDAKSMPKPDYVHLVDEVVEGLQSDEGYPLAALVMPATVEDIRAVSEHGERMPAKSTYFYPKLLSGLLFNPIE